MKRYKNLLIFTLLFLIGSAVFVSFQCPNQQQSLKRLAGGNFSSRPINQENQQSLSLENISKTAGANQKTSPDANQNIAQVDETPIQRNSQDTNQNNVQVAENQSAPKVIANPLPTDQEIQESINDQKRKRQVMNDLTEERDRRVALVNAELDVLSPEQLSPSEPAKISPAQSPPEDLVKKVRDRVYIWN